MVGLEAFPPTAKLWEQWIRFLSNMGRVGAVAGVGSVIVGGVYVGSTLVGGGSSPPADGTAHIWVDTSGGTCVDNSSPVAYDNATACTWDAANDTCDGGDSVGVKAGSYGDVELTGVQGRSSMCTFTVASGETVTADEWWSGRATSDTGSDWVTVVGPMTFRTLWYDQANQGTFDDITVDGQFSVASPSDDAQILHFEGSTNVVFKNGEVANACAVGGAGAMIMVISNGTTFDNNEIHDAHACDPSGEPHSECVYFWGNDNHVFTRNNVYRCWVQSVFVTSIGADDVASNLFFENNVIGAPCEENEDPHVCDTGSGGSSLHFHDGAAPLTHSVDGTFRYNIFAGGFDLGGSGGVSGTVVEGNIFLGGAECTGGATYSYNAHVSSSCGGTGSFANASLADDFVDNNSLASDGGDFQAAGGQLQVNAGNTGSYPALDLLGVSRYDGAAPDIGAYEKQE